jgi:hypothetical protein
MAMWREQIKRAAQTLGVAWSSEEIASISTSIPPTTMEVDSDPISEPKPAMSRIEQEHQHRLTNPVILRALTAGEKAATTEQERYLQDIGGEQSQRAAVPLGSPPSLKLTTDRQRPQNSEFDIVNVTADASNCAGRYTSEYASRKLSC